MILEVQNGCFGYPKQKEVLHDINISLEAGHILSILGPNGIGKTTLLKCMIGLLSWSSGHSLLNGQYIQQLRLRKSGTRYPIFRRHMAFLSPTPAWKWS